MKTNNNSTVNVNSVANYAQAHTGARNMRDAAGTISQACKSLSGIGDVVINIGRTPSKEKIMIAVKDYFKSLDIPYGNGRVIYSQVNALYNPYLVNEKGEYMLCKNVTQRVKIGKQSYILYRQDPNDSTKMKAVQLYQPAAMRANGWTYTQVCEALSQNKFIDEVKAMVDASKAEFDTLKANGGLYVHDALTNEYVPYTEK